MGYICVVGGANVDIFLSPYKKLKLRDSNPGQLRISCGGVGRNIAENLARLGNDVKLLTVLGNDGNAELIKSNAKQCGIDLWTATCLSAFRQWTVSTTSRPTTLRQTSIC